MGWQFWVQAAGVGGFFLGGGSLLLGIQNYRRQRDAPAREERRKERNELREHLFALKFDLQQAIRTMRSGEDIDLEDPDSLTSLQRAIPRYVEVLDAPTEDTLKNLGSMLIQTGAWWGLVAGRVEDSQRENPIQSDPQGRRRAALERDASEAFEGSIQIVNRIIDIINRANAND